MLTQKCKNDMGENEPETDSQRTNETKFLIEPNDAIWIHIQCLEYQLNYKAWLLLLLFINRLVSNQRNIKRAVLFHVRSELKKTTRLLGSFLWVWCIKPNGVRIIIWSF